MDLTYLSNYPDVTLEGATAAQKNPRWASRRGRASGSLVAGATSNAIVGFTGVDVVLVRVSKGTVYVTTDPVANIEDDSADWDALPNSEAAAAARHSYDPGITGVKITAPAGDAADWEVTG